MHIDANLFLEQKQRRNYLFGRVYATNDIQILIFFSSFTSFLSIFFFNCKTLDSFYTSSTICSQCSLAGIWLIKNFRQSLRFCVECDFSSDFTLPQVHFLCSPRRTFVCRCHLYTNRRRRERGRKKLSFRRPTSLPLSRWFSFLSGSSLLFGEINRCRRRRPRRKYIVSAVSHLTLVFQ